MEICLTFLQSRTHSQTCAPRRNGSHINVQYIRHITRCIYCVLDTYMCWIHGCYHGRYTDIYNLTTLCLNRTLLCVDFMDVIMGDIPIYNLTTLCLNRTLLCVDFMDVIMGDIPIYNLTTLCLNMTLLYVLISRMSSWEIYRYIT